jgi:hypothetical protein
MSGIVASTTLNVLEPLVVAAVRFRCAPTEKGTIRRSVTSAEPSFFIPADYSFCATTATSPGGRRYEPYEPHRRREPRGAKRTADLVAGVNTNAMRLARTELAETSVVNV